MLKQAKFSRTKEDFICEVCGAFVRGNGYTNHCPHCLTSKHVDINPGDRSCNCGGTMFPMRYELKKGKEYILHKCQKCGFERSNKIESTNDRAVVRLVAQGGWCFSDFNKKSDNK